MIGKYAIGLRAVGAGPIAADELTGTFAATDAGDTAAATGKITHQGTLAATDGSDTAAISGTVTSATGTLAATDSADAAAFAGFLRHLGIMAATDGPDGAAFVSPGNTTLTQDDLAAIAAAVWASPEAVAAHARLDEILARVTC